MEEPKLEEVAEEEIEEDLDELDKISEEELAAALGTGAAATAVAAAATAEQPSETDEKERKSEDKQSAELLSKLAGIDPEALRKLLAGAQVTISITFPKEV